MTTKREWLTERLEGPWLLTPGLPSPFPEDFTMPSFKFEPMSVVVVYGTVEPVLRSTTLADALRKEPAS
jgi:hypothetical protein